MSPPKAPPKVIVNVKIGQPGVEWIDALAEDHLTTRSDVIRHCLVIASKHEAEVRKRIKEFQ